MRDPAEFNAARRITTLYRNFGKRGFDLVLCTLGLAVSAPLQAVVALAIWRSMGRPVVFAQVRPGLDGRPFKMLKFRTMTSATAPDGSLLPDDQRLTSLGKALRSSSLDELPQLWNVLRGDMSLVGPRPFLMEYLPLYTSEQRHRHDVRPGLTGWTAVTGRNSQSWAQKLESDVWYTRHVSFGLDCMILWRTARVAMTGEGVSSDGHATAQAFTGTEN